MLPLLLRPGRLAVVIGGGAVGRRKAQACLDAGLSVLIVDPIASTFTHESMYLAVEEYVPEHLDGAALVFACGPAGLNRRVVADAQSRGIPVNSASDPESGDFILPAVARRQGVTLAVSTEGASPRLAAKIRDTLLNSLDEAWFDWVGLLTELRPLILNRIADESIRRRLLLELTDDQWLEMIRSDGVEVTRSRMLERIGS